VVAPLALGRPDWAERLLHVWLTKEQVKNSPDIDTDKPVSRQHEMTYSSYYGYPNYWGGAGYWGGGMMPNLMLPGYGGFGSPHAIHLQNELASSQGEDDGGKDEDPHLRSCREVMKYGIHASDGDIGHVEDMLVDDQTWAIRYLIVNTSNWWLGHRLLLAPAWIKNVSWFDSSVSVDLSREAIKGAPTYDPLEPLERRDEAELHDHYGRPGYWSDDVLLETEISRV
jgi:hypothetical protein